MPDGKAVPAPPESVEGGNVGPSQAELIKAQEKANAAPKPKKK